MIDCAGCWSVGSDCAGSMLGLILGSWVSSTWKLKTVEDVGIGGAVGTENLVAESLGKML